MSLERGHTAGTAPAQLGEPAKGKRRAPDAVSAAPGARLFSDEQAATYMGLSTWTVRDLIHAGTLSRVRLPLGSGADLRRILLDRLELDALIERSKEREPA